MTDLPDLLEHLARRLREEQADALVNAEAWKGSGFPNGPGSGRGREISRPTENAALGRTERAITAAERFPGLLQAVEVAVDHTLRALDALKVVLPTEAFCVRCGNVTDRPHFHNDEPHCQACHDAGDWRREQKRDWMRTYRSDQAS